MEEIEKAFASTSAIVLGKKLQNIDDYAEWLTKYVGRVITAKSAIGNKTVYLPLTLFYERVKNNMVPMQEALELGKKSLGQKEIEDLNISNAPKLLEKIKITTPDVVFGTNLNIVETAAVINSSNSYRTSFCGISKYSGYSYWPRESEYMFGCRLVFSSKFCIKCYNSTNLTRCFEISDSFSCTDSYFCHNCENLDNCMFCFNTKSKRYAIANKEIGKEAYLKIKKLVLDEIGKKIEKEKNLSIDIYSIGCRGGN